MSILKDFYEEYNDKINELKAENERLKRVNEILLGQLVINDGEDVTVQISKSQFDEYNKFRTCLQEIKAIAEYIMTSDTEKWTLDEPFKQIEKILELTKVESEG